MIYAGRPSFFGSGLEDSQYPNLVASTLRLVVPTTIPDRVFGTRVLKRAVNDPFWVPD